MILINVKQFSEEKYNIFLRKRLFHIDIVDDNARYFVGTTMMNSSRRHYKQFGKSPVELKSYTIFHQIFFVIAASKHITAIMTQQEYNFCSRKCLFLIKITNENADSFVST